MRVAVVVEDISGIQATIPFGTGLAVAILHRGAWSDPRPRERRSCTMRKAIMLGTVFGVGMAIPLLGERDAWACGGCFVPPAQNVDSQITGERMIFSISTLQSTLYDEITYSGSPASFAWVLPIKGKADVGLSADLLFATLDQATASTVLAPPTNCPAPPTCYGTGPLAPGGGSSAAGGSGGSANHGVTVLSQAQVG